jgi:hypothetical protein
VVDATFEIVRERLSPAAPTTGELLVEGEHFCWTLERPWRDNIPGTSCIPLGAYSVFLTLSTRFKREMPRLIGVPGRVGILIHSGNTDHDTEGCILVGNRRDDGVVYDSRLAFERFLAWFASVGNRAMVTVR